jgi:hypothetical protein
MKPLCKLYVPFFLNLCCSINIKEDGTEEMKNAYKILVPKPKVERLLGRPMCRMEDNIRTDHVAQDRKQ